MLNNIQKKSDSTSQSHSKPSSKKPNPPSVLFPPQPKNNKPTNNEFPAPPPAPSDNPSAPNQPNPPAVNPKKILAQKIKTDLANDLERIKNNEKPLLKYVLVSDYTINIWDEKNSNQVKVISCGVFPNDLNLEKDDFDEIIILIKEFNQLQEEKEQAEKDKIREEERKKVFIFRGSNRKPFSKIDIFYYAFQGLAKQGEKETILFFPLEHPGLTNIFAGKHNDPQDNSKNGNFYLIEGLQSIPTEPHFLPFFQDYPCKYPKLEDKITIAPHNQ